MRRRTYLQRLVGSLGWLAVAPFKVFSQKSGLNPQERAKLGAMAVIVLPSKLGPSGVGAVVSKFDDYVRDYRAGADTEHGYGFTKVVPKPPSPAATYSQQLASLPSPLTRQDVKAALEQAGIRELPRVPDGKHVISDLMAFYFRSSEANDLCYAAFIGRDQCRGLAGSERPPKPLAVVAS